VTDPKSEVIRMARVVRPVVNQRESSPARRGAFEARPERVLCPRCDRWMAKVIGRSEVIAIIYLRCDGCQRPSVVSAPLE
jgi:hypothetical protein